MKTLGIIVAGFLLVAFALRTVHAQTGTVSATVRPNPLTVDISVPASVTVGQWFDVTADVANLGQETLTQTVVSLNTPGEIKVKNQRKKIGNLTAGTTQTLKWQAKANASGDFIIQVEATANLAAEQISSSDSQVISAVGSLGAFLLRLIFGA